ncbi:MAG: hypothetical protein M1835_001023, partial [Candelina submexicana]
MAEPYPLASKEALRSKYVGKSLSDIPMPAAIIDVSVVSKNCNRMLEAIHSLGVEFRPHVKTHKILYGLPLPPSQVLRLAAIGTKLGPSSTSVMIDHPCQVDYLKAYRPVTGHAVQLFVKLDTGYHRAGIDIDGRDAIESLLQTIRQSEDAGYSMLQGVYSHAGHSYSGSSPEEAMLLLQSEIERSLAVADFTADTFNFGQRRFVISVGATPTATSIQNLIFAEEHSLESLNLKNSIAHAKQSYTVELHAGVYPLLDLQQLATAARPMYSPGKPTLSYQDLALTIMVEVASLYKDRKAAEALIAAGCLALGREPCKSYPGWGVVTNWNYTTGRSVRTDAPTQWIVGRISQEHGVLTSNDPGAEEIPLVIGQRLRVWPNHACVAGAGFGWYFVVDSSKKGYEDQIVDIWVRWR